MTDAERRAAAKQFAADWKDRGDEKQETQTFWLSLLQKVYGVAEPDKFISFEKTVTVDDTKTGKSTTKFIDGYIGATRVLIEQKGAKIDLDKGETQSDGSILSPYQQARRYGGYLPANQQPRWIVVCNFKEFRIHDMNHPNDTPGVLLLADLEKEYNRLSRTSFRTHRSGFYWRRYGRHCGTSGPCRASPSPAAPSRRCPGQ